MNYLETINMLSIVFLISISMIISHNFDSNLWIELLDEKLSRKYISGTP